jgi:uncharacterized metal-binding protein YceD (DUF177 family)
MTRHSVHPFVLPLASLAEGNNVLQIEGGAEDVDITPEEADIPGAIILEGGFYRFGEHVEVQGRIQAVVNMACDRCLAPVAAPIHPPFRLFCEKKEVRDRRSGSESQDEDVGLLYHDGRNLDLREEIRNVILLEVPWHPLCRSDCRGLCPRCGRNLNEGECACPRDRGASPWDVLRNAVEGDPPASDVPRGRKE